MKKKPDVPETPDPRRHSTAREWYRTFHARAPAGAPVIGVDRMIVPGPAFANGLGGT